MSLSGGGHLVNLFTLEDADSDGLPERASVGSIEVTSSTGINYPSDLGCALVLVGTYSSSTVNGLMYHDFQNCFNQNYIYYKLVYNLWKSSTSVNTSNGNACVAIDDGTTQPAYNNNRLNNSCEGYAHRLQNSTTHPSFMNVIGNATYPYPRIAYELYDDITASWCGVMGEMNFWHPYRTDSFTPCQMYGTNIVRDNVNNSETWRWDHSAHWEPNPNPSTGLRMWIGNANMSANLEASNFTAMMYAYKSS